MKRITRFSLGLAFWGVALPGAATLVGPVDAALAEALTSRQLACVVALNKAADKVAAAQMKVGGQCMTAFDLGREAAPDLCVGSVSTPTAAVLSAMEKTSARDQRKCGDVAVPPFAYAGAASTNSGGFVAAKGLFFALHGTPLSSSVAATSEDPLFSEYLQCRTHVLDKTARVLRTTGKVFSQCLRRSIQDGAATDEATLADSCLALDGSGVVDSRGKVAKQGGKLLSEIEECLTDGLDLSRAFPGLACGSFSGGAFASCVEREIRCGHCRLIDASLLLGLNCELFDDGMDNLSCELAYVTTSTTSTSTTTTSTSTITTTSTSTSTTTVPLPEETDILFIGNSYTAANSLRSLVAGLAEASGRPVYVASITPGGARFAGHSENATTLALLRSRDWDAVVLQNQSQVPGWRLSDVTQYSLPYAHVLADVAREAEVDPRLVYFMTWGRRDGDANYCGYYPLVCTFEGHTEALHDGYTLYTQETGGELSPVGLAWANVRKDVDVPFDPTLLWSGDGSHPSLRGSYLAAAVLYSTIFAEGPEGLSYTGGLTAGDAAYLQTMAARTWEEGLIAR